ncbi:hypothetical protein [Streptomyces mordarskii]|uniref:HNH endonuclease n=1 Tax=Streptomyces mordarskii TaxID=1226758 RepID=A0ABN1ETY5_9ACTN
MAAMTMPQVGTKSRITLLAKHLTDRDPPLRRAEADLRAGDIDPLQTTPETQVRLWGWACARCGGSDTPLTPGGYAYTQARGGARLGWLVQLCERCASTSDLRTSR